MGLEIGSPVTGREWQVAHYKYIYLLYPNKSPFLCFYYRGPDEKIALQSNKAHNSQTLAQTHIQVDTKDPIQLGVAKWALL